MSKNSMMEFIKATYPHGWRDIFGLLALLAIIIFMVQIYVPKTRFYQHGQEYIMQNKYIEDNFGKIKKTRLGYETIKYGSGEWVLFTIVFFGEKGKGAVKFILEMKNGKWEITKAKLESNKLDEPVFLIEGACNSSAEHAFDC